MLLGIFSSKVMLIDYTFSRITIFGYLTVHQKPCMDRKPNLKLLLRPMNQRKIENSNFVILRSCSSELLQVSQVVN
jgi:hypothetical protein